MDTKQKRGMINRIKIVFITIFICSVISCKNETRNEKQVDIIKFDGESPKDFVKLIGLPDTLRANEKYETKIKYFSINDTIIEDIERYVFLNFSFGDKKFNSTQKIKNSKNFREFNFDNLVDKEVSINVQLEKKGNCFLSFAIEDIITFEKIIDGKNRLITKDLSFIKKVFVKD